MSPRSRFLPRQELAASLRGALGSDPAEGLGHECPVYVFPAVRLLATNVSFGSIGPTGRSQAKVRQGPTRRPVYESAARLGHAPLPSSEWSPARRCSRHRFALAG